MKILYRYTIKEYSFLFFSCLFVFFILYLVIDFVQKADNFIDANADLRIIIEYFCYKIPYIIVQLIPAAVLIASIILFSNIKRKNEILAVKICGINPFRFLIAMLFAAFWTTAVLLFISEFIVPYSSSKSNDIWKYEVEKRERGKFYGSHQIWYHGKNAIYWIKHFKYEEGLILNPTLFFFDDDYDVIRKITAREGRWSGDHWVVRDAVIQELREEGSYVLTQHETYDLSIPETPETFMKEVKDPEEMSILEIREYANQLRMDGYENTRYLVNMHVKIAYYAVIVIMMVIGFSVPLVQDRVNIPLSMSVGLGTCFVYILLFAFSRSLGLSGRIPPVLAAWLSNGVFLLLGAYLLTLVRR